MPITFGDLKNAPSTLPAKVNLCPTDARFADLCNRAHDLLLEHGSWWGTEQEVNLAVADKCIVLPAVVASLEGLRGCDYPIRIENQWYRLMPTFNPQLYNECGIWWEYRDNVPSFNQLEFPRILRSFISTDDDIGKTIKFIGYDKNGVWVRTRQGGLWQDGELVTLAQPFVDTVTEFKSVTAIIKEESNDVVTVFSHPSTTDDLTAFGIYQYWETRPTYQRFRIVGWENLNYADCCYGRVLTARVKLAYIPVQYDDDLFLIQNRQAMEYGVQAMKAIDDGNVALADVLLNGDRNNLRTGAIPLLQQELRTHTGDRFVSNVQIPATKAIKRAMIGFI